MRVAIDWNVCIGSGQCLLASDGAFGLVEAFGEQRAVLSDASASDAQLLAAARACPTMAIRLWDDGGALVY